MVHHNAVLAQMLKLIPTCLSRQGHEFESLTNPRHSARRLRKMTCWTQFVSMATAQASLCRAASGILPSRRIQDFLSINDGGGEMGLSPSR